MVALTAVHESIHDIQDAQPQIQHSSPLTEHDEVMEEDLAKQRGCLHTGVAHPSQIRLEYLWLEESSDQRKQDIAKYRGPFAVGGVAGHFWAKQTLSEEAKRGITDLAARVCALRTEALEYGQPVCRPRLVLFEVRLRDEIGYPCVKGIDHCQCLCSAGDDFDAGVVGGFLLEFAPTRRYILSLLVGGADVGFRSELVQ